MFRPVMLMSKELSSRSSPSSCSLQIARMCTKENHGKISSRSHGTQGEQYFRHCSSCLWSKQWKQETQRRTYGTRSWDLASATPMATAPGGAGIKYTDIPLTSLRQSLAERLLRAKPTVPHWYFSVDIKMDAALKLREEFNRALQKDNIKISVNDLVIKATALACTKVPQANSSWQGTFIRQYKSVNVCMSVDTPRGLVIPVVHAAEKKGLASISEETRSLALKARDNKLQPHDLEGGTVSVTNVGMIGVTSFPGMVNPPQRKRVYKKHVHKINLSPELAELVKSKNLNLVVNGNDPLMKAS
ncbi:dihydrolipoyllysine-residue acetyltransferase component of pyruvate dehydrogenase complex, mitochondrial [Ixodes scapularis]|uniref:dihydrolipoyllysine-residue acetyltransferase component of pyruvate dehydrogenase complex, mitochondrial n=1 Tax=Ixodes scapularis TaxID=6945 RepID=UPI001C388B5F|nr:dihydrolipoyllysine-residue acetyltransferase component of pyruvate dehydrogenase complex, mitochondrial [Ixodes scapularis]